MAMAQIKQLFDIPGILEAIKRAPVGVVKAIHRIMFLLDGDRGNRQRIRQFEGFKFDLNSDEFEARVKWMVDNLTPTDLTAVCIFFNLDYGEPELVLAKHICTKLINLNNFVHDGEDDEEEEERENRPVGTTQMNEINSVPSEKLLSSGSSKFTMTFRDVQNTIRSFNGEDSYSVEFWIRDFEEIAEIMGWSDLEKLVCARRSMSGVAKQYIQSERGLNTWNKFKCSIHNEFSESVSGAELHKLLANRIMKKEESV